MCSPQCPCYDADDASLAKAWSEVKDVATVHERDLVKYPWNFSGGKDGYKTYKACIDDADRVTDTKNAQDVAFATFAKSFREQSDYNTISDWIAFFEDDYECAGICEPSLFAW